MKGTGQMDLKNLEIHFIGLCNAHKTEMRECSFTDSDIHSCFMDFTRVHDSRWGNASFTKMYMEKSAFEEVNLNNSDLHNLAMMNCDFDNVTLTETKFANTAMNKSSFSNSNLSNAKFYETDFSGAEIDKSCNLDGMTIDGIPVRELLSLYKEKNN